MWNYLFEVVDEGSDLNGERFFVQCKTRKEADEIVIEYFCDDRVAYLGKYSDEEAEWMGYDTY